MSEKGIRKLAVDDCHEYDLIPEVKNVHIDKCANSLAAKQNRTSFRSRPPMRRKALHSFDKWFGFGSVRF